MSQFTAFSRGINVGGNRTVTMEKLHRVFESLGYSGVATFIASENVVFGTASKDTAALERKIETGLLHALSYEVATFIRTDAELSRVAEYKAFDPSRLTPPDEIYIVFLKNTPDKATIEKLSSLRIEADSFHCYGREVYWLRRKSRNTHPIQLFRSKR
jgi:uncharacterized protein (DUF1697 family)